MTARLTRLLAIIADYYFFSVCPFVEIGFEENYESINYPYRVLLLEIMIFIY